MRPSNNPTSTATDNGIYYFLGNIPSHVLHALPLHKKIGGTFIVLSKKAKKELEAYDIPVLVIDDKPKEGLKLGLSVRKTINFLNSHARVVLFYEIFQFTKSYKISGPKTIFLTHGNMLKSYMTMNPIRLKAIKDYDYMAALGPFLKHQFISEDGIDPKKLVDVGIARTDDVIKNRGKAIKDSKLLSALGVEPSQKIVSYMPTFWGASSVHKLGKDITRYFPDNYTLIFRPHPQTPRNIIEEYLCIASEKPNFIYAPEGRFPSLTLTKAYELSDLIIGDVSSVMLEAILIDKPLVFAFENINDKHEKKAYKAIQEIVDYSTKIDEINVQLLPYLIENSLARGIDKKIWNETKDNTFFNHDGTCIESLKQFIYSLK